MTRIVIDPDSLRSTARGLNEAASELGLYARGIGNTDVSAFAPDIRGIAAGVTQNVRRELVAVSSEWGQEADVLRDRASRAESGVGSDFFGWALATMLLPSAPVAPRGKDWWLSELARWLPGDDTGPTERWRWGVGGAGVISFLGEAARRKTLGWRAMYDIRRIGVEATGRDMGLIRRTGRIGPVGMLGALTNAAGLGADLGSGRYDRIAVDALRVGADVLSVAAKRLGMYGAAFSAGMWFGESLDRRFELGDKGSRAIQGNAIASLYGGKTEDELTWQEGNEYGKRYNGVVGFGRFVQDGVGTAVQPARTFLDRLF